MTQDPRPTRPRRSQHHRHPRQHRLAAAISEAAWGELARQLRYKKFWRGGQALTANRRFLSSKTCSNCEDVDQTLTLADRVVHCENCRHTLDRDLNTAVNLATGGEPDHAQVLDPPIGRLWPTSTR